MMSIIEEEDNIVSVQDNIVSVQDNIVSVQDNIVSVPWVGPLSCKNTITVIVVSTSAEIIERIAEALSDVHKKGNYRWKFVVHRSFYLDAVLKQSFLTGRIALDFVILAIDTSKMYCLEWAQTVLGQVHTDLRSRRCVVVNVSDLSASEMVVNPGEIIAFQKENKLDLITCDRLNTDGAPFLAKRLINYIEATIGTHTGIPNINV